MSDSLVALNMPEESRLVTKIAHELFMPLVLLINYSMLLYLIVCYWSRRTEWRIALLLSVGLLSVLTLIPFADPNHDLVMHLNDVSESCCELVFLLQITIIGRDVNKRMRFRVVLYLTYVAETLTAIDLASVVFSSVLVIDDNMVSDSLGETLPNVCETVTLVYVLFFRFYYIFHAKGWRDVVHHRKRELLLYIALAIHETPFMLMGSVDEIARNYIQAFVNRLLIAGCIWVTAVSELRHSLTSRVSRTNREASSAMKLQTPYFARRSSNDASSRRDSAPRITVSPSKRRSVGRETIGLPSTTQIISASAVPQESKT